MKDTDKESIDSLLDMHLSILFDTLHNRADTIVRGVLRHNKTGELFEVVGIDRTDNPVEDQRQIVPLFIVPVGGTRDLTENYTVVPMPKEPSSSKGVMH